MQGHCWYCCPLISLLSPKRTSKWVTLTGFCSKLHGSQWISWIYTKQQFQNWSAKNEECLSFLNTKRAYILLIGLKNRDNKKLIGYSRSYFILSSLLYILTAFANFGERFAGRGNHNPCVFRSWNRRTVFYLWRNSQRKCRGSSFYCSWR